MRRSIVEMVQTEGVSQFMGHDRNEIDASVIKLEPKPLVRVEIQFGPEAFECPHVEGNRAALDLGPGKRKRKLRKKILVIETQLHYEKWRSADIRGG
jgi:hypothetical protein